MNKNPKFSIIIPIYNVEKYLVYCLESIFGQTLKDIEIICINDGSTDNSLNILEQYVLNDDRICVINQQNAGSSAARNAGLLKASGDYIMFVDSDDRLHERACERLYEEIVQTDADMIVFGTNIFPILWERDNGWLYTFLNVNYAYYQNDSLRALFQERASKPFIWNKCYRRTILQENNVLFDNNLTLGEDNLFLFQIFPYMKNIVYLPDKLYYYRCERKGSLMDISAHDIEKKLFSHLILIDKVLSVCKSNDYICGYESKLYYWCLDLIVNEIENPVLTKQSQKQIVNELEHLMKKYQMDNVRMDKETKKLHKVLKSV